MSITQQSFLAGVIEGFYGRQWTWQQRHDCIEFLAQYQFNSYVYAPKADSCLRKQWRQPWPQQQLLELTALAEQCRNHQIAFGVGLSPFELYLDFSSAQKKLLIAKLQQIERLQPSVLCILFDDMRGDVENLAKLQCEICDFVEEHSNVDKLIMCPTYYSFDPVLEKVFGTMPENYWQELADGLSPSWDVFWTGDKVVSANYSAHSLAKITQLLQRKPLLWDNYPVNDGAKMSKHLHLTSVERPSSLCSEAAGVLCNPMNQAALSQLPLGLIASQLHGESAQVDTIAAKLYGDDLAAELVNDTVLFQQQGLAMVDSQKAELLAKYQQYSHPAAIEVCEWLQGGYVFDPDCLTD